MIEIPPMSDTEVSGMILCDIQGLREDIQKIERAISQTGAKVTRIENVLTLVGDRIRALSKELRRLIEGGVERERSANVEFYGNDKISRTSELYAQIGELYEMANQLVKDKEKAVEDGERLKRWLDNARSLRDDLRRMLPEAFSRGDDPDSNTDTER